MASAMTQQVRTRNQKTIDYSSNGLVTEQLGRGMLYREIRLNLTGQLTATGGNNTAAKTEAGDEWACIDEIRIVANGTDEIRRIAGKDLWWLNRFMYNRNPQTTAALGDGSTANPAFDSILCIPFWSMNSRNSMDTFLDSSKMSELRIEIKWATHAAINADASGFTVAPSVTVNTLESFFTTNKRFEAFTNQRLYKIIEQPTGSNPNFEIEFPVGPMYRGFFINTTVSGADDPNCVSNVKAFSGTNIFHDIDWTMLNQIEPMYLGIGDTLTGGQYVANRRSVDSNFKAWALFDFSTDGLLTECIDTIGYSEFKLRFEVLKACQINIYPIQLIPPRSK